VGLNCVGFHHDTTIAGVARLFEWMRDANSACYQQFLLLPADPLSVDVAVNTLLDQGGKT